MEKATLREIFPSGMLTVVGVPEKNRPQEQEAILFFVRAAGDPNWGTYPQKKKHWSESAVDVKIKEGTEAALGLKLSPWFEINYQ